MSYFYRHKKKPDMGYNPQGRSNARMLLLMLVLLFPQTASAQQFLPVEKIVNARDLGGYEVAGGQIVKTGRLFRTAHLADATHADLQYLSGVPTVKIIDFRMEFEKKGKIDQPIPCAEYIWLPMDASGPILSQSNEKDRKAFTGSRSFDIRKIIVLIAFNEKAQKIARLLYQIILTDPGCQRQMAAFLRYVVDTKDDAVLFHCTQGKDRTGVAAALLLAALGADRETIVADFDATNRIYEADVRKYTKRVKFWGGGKAEIGTVKSFLGANTENFIKALDEIDETYGSLEAYLKGPMGLSDADLHTLRERYLERIK